MLLQRSSDFREAEQELLRSLDYLRSDFRSSCCLLQSDFREAPELGLRSDSDLLLLSRSDLQPEQGLQRSDLEQELALLLHLVGSEESWASQDCCCYLLNVSWLSLDRAYSS